ncbi:MAG: SLC13 family permease [Gammaproteobacteria bacterium]|jgi:sodium-dependent dicarboxylate transporter 2/3/5
MSRANIGLIAGLSLFAILVLMPTPEGMPIEAKHVAAVATLMAIFWMTEAIPIPATSLIPIFLYPLLKVMPGTQVTLSYANHLIYLYMGGFLIAVTMEKWNLHKRIALQTIHFIGITPDRIVLGFMVATGFLSMWISNTAAAMMMVTIAMAVVSQVIKGIGDDDTLTVDTRVGHFRFGAALMLGIAYAASIGGVATLVGTPTNAVFAGIVESTFGITISLVDWMKIGFPIATVALFITWFLLVKIIYPSEISHLPGGKEIIHRELKSLGNMSKEEKMVLAIFSTVASLWILRGFVKIDAISMVADSTIAIGGAVLLFMLPSNFKKREFLLDWDTAVKIPWDILLLFGGGFALATGFSESGLTTYMASKLTILEGTSIYLIIPVVATMIIFLTELTSNTATNSIMLPIMAALAGAMMIHPYGLMITTTIAASFAFMLPVATPPNAIVFGSRNVTIDQMMKAGIWLNIMGIILISALVLFLLPIVWDIDLTTYSLPIQN